jgi:uncharacterized membrane protein
MPALSVWTFPQMEGAHRAESLLGALSVREGVVVDDGAVLTWAPDRSHPRIRQLQSIALVDTVGGEFWALLVGTAFLLPTLQVLAGSDARTAGVWQGVGISASFIDDLRVASAPGTSALAVLTAGDAVAVIDAVVQTLTPRRASAVLTDAERCVLGAVFVG